MSMAIRNNIIDLYAIWKHGSTQEKAAVKQLCEMFLASYLESRKHVIK